MPFDNPPPLMLLEGRVGFNIAGASAERAQMAYVATWRKGQKVVATEMFANLLDAQEYILAHLEDYSRIAGADFVQVTQGQKVVFDIKPATQRVERRPKVAPPPAPRRASLAASSGTRLVIALPPMRSRT